MGPSDEGVNVELRVDGPGVLAVPLYGVRYCFGPASGSGSGERRKRIGETDRRIAPGSTNSRPFELTRSPSPERGCHLYCMYGSRCFRKIPIFFFFGGGGDFCGIRLQKRHRGRLGTQAVAVDAAARTCEWMAPKTREPQDNEGGNLKTNALVNKQARLG